MPVAWIAPLALLGAGLIVLPIAIHLLVRQHARTLAYPSLRFLRETQLAAFRRRTIQDAWLLLCRAAIITAAAMALAGPLLQTASRTAGYASRTSRAIVSVSSIDDAIDVRLRSGAFASAMFQRPVVADSLIDAVRWLNEQAPSARELVIAGAMRRGSITEADLAAIPSDIGLRFEMVATPSVADVIWPILTRRDGTLVRIDRSVHFAADSTRVADGKVTPVRSDLVSITAPAADEPLADAALRAALDAGVPWSHFEKPVVIAWDAAPSPAASAADAVLIALRNASGHHGEVEPVTIAQEQLNKWSRPAGPPAANAPLKDEGDRRWLWGLVLALIGVETWLRRGRSSASQSATEAEARVA